MDLKTFPEEEVAVEVVPLTTAGFRDFLGELRGEPSAPGSEAGCSASLRLLHCKGTLPIAIPPLVCCGTKGWR